MFEISWSELLILAIVTLVFVGPKELPVFLRTIGKYAGVVKRQASEFRAQFDAAMREAELDAMKKEFHDMQSTVNAEVMRAKTDVAAAVAPPPASAVARQPAIAEPAPAAAVTPPMPATPGQER